jgi:hypothetical protein
VVRLKQSFQNKTDRPQFINLELSTARFRLDSGDELILFYDADGVMDDAGAALRIEFIMSWESVELVVWTNEDQMFFPDGSPAPQNFDHL